MNITVDTMLHITDEGMVGLYTSVDSFEAVVDERKLGDMVDEYCQLFSLPNESVISSDCVDLVLKLRSELQEALGIVEGYVQNTAAYVWEHKQDK